MAKSFCNLTACLLAVIASCAARSQSGWDVFSYRTQWAPGEPVSLSVYAAPQIRLNASIWAARPLNQPPDAAPSASQMTLMQQPVVRNVTLPPRPRRGNTMRDLMLPALKEGVYQVQVTDGKRITRIPINITRLALVARQHRDTLWVQAVDMRSGAPLTGARIWLRSQSVTEQRTDASGMARFTVMSGTQPLVWGQYGQSVAWFHAAEPQSVADLRGYLYTERPVYRPGQTVHFRGIIRSQTGRPLAGTEAAVSFQPSGDESSVTVNCVSSARGVFHGSFTLSPYANPSSWSAQVRFTQGDTVLPAELEIPGFDVAAYRKPDYAVKVAPTRARVLGGQQIPFQISARLLSGEPLVGARVFVQAMRSDWLDDTDGYSGYSETVGDEIELRTGADGSVITPIRAWALPHPYRLSVMVRVMDASGRSEVSEGGIDVLPGDIEPVCEVLDRFPAAGRPAPIRVSIRPSSGSRHRSGTSAVSIYRSTYNARTNASREERVWRWSGAMQTHNPVTLNPVLSRSGMYRVQMQATDPEGRNWSISDWMWLERAGESPDVPDRQLSLRVDQQTGKPGDTLHAVVTSPGASGVLMTIEGSRLHEARWVPLRQGVGRFDITLTTEHQPGIVIAVSSVRNSSVTTAEHTVTSPQTDRQLNVTVQADPAASRPGATTSIAVTVTDAKGKPAQAEVAIGAVDEGIYLIRSESGPSAFEALWGARPNEVQSFSSIDASFAAGPGKEAAMAGMGGEDVKSRNPAVRRRFVDTALWAPEVLTDPDGKATVELPLPDNLTTWRVKATAVGDGATVGDGTGAVVSALPVSARLSVPRFLRAGDSARIAVVGYNHTDTPLPLGLMFDSTEPTALKVPCLTDDLTPAGSQRVLPAWLSFPRPGTVLITGTAITPELSDAMEWPVTIQPAGLTQTRVQAVSVTGNAQAALPVPVAGDKRHKVTVRVERGAAAMAHAGTQWLLKYPYGCIEQTCSPVLAVCALLDMSKRLGIPLPDEEVYRQQVESRIARILAAQSLYDGWRWTNMSWGGGDALWSAYALHTLQTARQNGFAVPEQAIRSGLEAMSRLAVQHGAPASQKPEAVQRWLLRQDARAAVLAQITGSDPPLANRLADRLFGIRTQLSTSARCDLASALWKLGRRSQAMTLRTELINGRIQTGGLSYWRERPRVDLLWYGQDTLATARVLRLLLETGMSASEPMVQGAVRWLTGARRGNGVWLSTNDTAAAVQALALTASAMTTAAGELSVSTPSGPAGTLTWSGSDLFAEPELTLSGEQAQATSLHFLASTPVQVVVAVEDELAAGRTPRGEHVRVTRAWYRAVPRKSPKRGEPAYELTPLRGPVRQGEALHVKLVITSAADLGNVLVTDPLPAGMEALEIDNNDLWPSGYWYGMREIYDDRVAWLMPELLRGVPQVLWYTVRAQFAGAFHTPPTEVQSMYLPGVGGYGSARQMQIEAGATP